MHENHTYHIKKKRSSDLCVNGVHYFVMLFLTIKYFNSTANNQVKYLYLYCLAQRRLLLAGTIQHTPTNIKCWHYNTPAFYSRLSIFEKHQQLCRSQSPKMPKLGACVSQQHISCKNCLLSTITAFLFQGSFMSVILNLWKRSFQQFHT